MLRKETVMKNQKQLHSMGTNILNTTKRDSNEKSVIAFQGNEYSIYNAMNNLKKQRVLH